jgi:hypothetical protein
MICENNGKIDEESSPKKQKLDEMGDKKAMEQKKNQIIKKHMEYFMQVASTSPKTYNDQANKPCNMDEFEKIMKQADTLFTEGKQKGLYTINLREILTGKPENQKIYVPLPVTADTYTLGKLL